MSISQQAQFFSLLADLLQSGFQFQQALKMIGMLAPNLGKTSRRLYKGLVDGKSFSEVIKPSISVNSYSQLMIAEKHGFLEKSIRQLGQLMEKRVEQKKKIQSLLMYPIILLLVLGLVISAVKLWLLPQLSQFNNYSGLQSPNWWLIIKILLLAGGIILAIYLLKIFYWWSKQKTIIRHNWYAEIPIFGRLYKQYTYYYLTFNAGMLLKGGMDLKQIKEYLLLFDPSSLLYQIGTELDTCIKSGQDISSFLERYSFFPPEISFFMGKGETLDQLGDELLVYSGIAYKRLLSLSSRMINYIQPILFLIIAALIIGTYVSILLPLYHSIGGIYKGRL